MTFDPAKRSTRLSVTSSRTFSDGSQSRYLPWKLTGMMSDTTMSFCPVGSPFSSRRGLALEVRKAARWRSEEHTSELQSLMRISYAVFCLKKKKKENKLNKKTRQINNNDTA